MSLEFGVFVTVTASTGYQNQKESMSMVDSLILCMHIYNISYMNAYIYIHIIANIYKYDSNKIT